MRKLLLGSGSLVLASYMALAPGTANAADNDGNPTGDLIYQVGSANVLWVTMAQNFDGSGHTIKIMGNADGCTVGAHSPIKASDSDLYGNAGWNDDISYEKDVSAYHCDVKLFEDANFDGGNSGWLNHPNGAYVTDNYNDWATSFRIG